jgi:thymidine kinase
MFSGKTTELLRRLRRFTIAKRRCVVLKYNRDIRYDDSCAATHDQQKAEAIACGRLGEVDPSRFENVDVIGIDEGQFFPDCVDFSEKMANQGKVVIVAALDGTFERKPFGNILNLVPLAEVVTKLSAVCMVCQGEAAFSKRIGNEKKVEVIGGAEKYLAACRQCYQYGESKALPQLDSSESAIQSERPSSPSSPVSSDSPPQFGSSSSDNEVTPPSQRKPKRKRASAGGVGLTPEKIARTNSQEPKD